MEQDERAVIDPSEVNTEQDGEATAAVHAGEVAGSEMGEQERVSEAENSLHGKAASEGANKQVIEEPSPESDEIVAASIRIESKAFENPIAVHFEFRAAAADADATPPPTSFRAWSKGWKHAGATRFFAAEATEGTGSEAPVLGAFSSSAPATGRLEDVSAMAGGDRCAAPGDEKLKRAFSVPGARVAIAHAAPPDSYRRVPSQSRKQYSPKRFVAAPPPADSPGSVLPSASASTSEVRVGIGTRADSDATASSGVIDASASSSSNRPPCRGRKQPRPEHFIPEEAEAAASAKARRSDIVLDRFLSSIVHGSRATDSEWARNVTAEDAAVRDQRQRGGEGFRIRDVSRNAARALSRLGCASPSSSSPSSSAPGEPGGSGRRYGVLAALGASLALTVVAYVLVYIVGKSSEPGPSGETPDE